MANLSFQLLFCEFGAWFYVLPALLNLIFFIYIIDFPAIGQTAAMGKRMVQLKEQAVIEDNDQKLRCTLKDDNQNTLSEISRLITVFCKANSILIFPNNWLLNIDSCTPVGRVQ